MSTDEENEVVTVKQMHLDYLHRLAGNPGPRSVEGFEEIRLPNNKGPQVEFLGKIRAVYDTQNKHRTKQRWQEIRLWETPVGNWVVESVGCSDDDGQVDITNVGVFQINEPNRELAVMDFLDWGYAARALASKMGWKLVRRIA